MMELGALHPGALENAHLGKKQKKTVKIRAFARAPVFTHFSHNVPHTGKWIKNGFYSVKFTTCE